MLEIDKESKIFNDFLTNNDLEHISPIGLLLRASIEHKVITTMGEYEAFKKKTDGFDDQLDLVLYELEQRGLIELEDEKIILLSDNFWSTTDPKKSLKSLPELSRIVTERGLKTRASGDFNKYLDFGVVHYFPEDPELLPEASQILLKCGQELSKLSKMVSKNKKNKKVRAVSFSASVLNEGDF